MNLREAVGDARSNVLYIGLMILLSSPFWAFGDKGLATDMFVLGLIVVAASRLIPRRKNS